MSTRSPRSKAPAKDNLEVTPEEGRIENVVVQPETQPVDQTPEPAVIEVETPSENTVVAEEAAAPEKIQTNVREKLANRSIEENIFVPSNPAALEKAAAQVSQEMGFELNRGTSIGARLLARAQNKVQ